MGQVSLKGKDLLGLQNVSPEEIKLILDVAKKLFFLMTRRFHF